MHRWHLIASVGLCVGLASCAASECIIPPCPATLPVTLTLRDAVDGGPVLDGLVNGVPCHATNVCVGLESDGGLPGVGLVSFEVSAAGYQTAHLTVNVPAAPADVCTCKPGYVPQTRDVILVPL